MNKVIVGMSGGVDSSVAASVLIKKGYNVEGLFMKNWEEDSEFCSSQQDFKDALQVCDKLNITLHSANFAKEYWERVFKHFINEYKIGRTPNPDILCNTEIKFKEFLKYAIDIGADKIATGHYAQRQTDGDNYLLKMGRDRNKDQSYFLYGLNQEQISKAMFPIGDLDKTSVRNKAKELGFRNFKKKDSVGICFIGKRNMKEFLKDYIPPNPGDIITDKGKLVGKHDGLMYYTIGQRKGLGIGGGFSKSDGAWYVINKDIQNNELIVVQGLNNSALYHQYIEASGLHWIIDRIPPKDNLMARIRYRGKNHDCKILGICDDKISIKLKKSCFGIASGQSVVFYDGDICLGGAIIESYSN